MGKKKVDHKNMNAADATKLCESFRKKVEFGERCDTVVAENVSLMTTLLGSLVLTCVLSMVAARMLDKVDEWMCLFTVVLVCLAGAAAYTLLSSYRTNVRLLKKHAMYTTDALLRLMSINRLKCDMEHQTRL